MVSAIRAYNSARKQLTGAQTLLADPTTDSEMKNLAAEEERHLRERFAALERDVKLMLLPKDSADSSSAIVEVRAGTGGQEAALFAGDLLKMYTRYAQLQGWKADLMSISESDLGGIKEAVLDIEGEGVYAKLKFESGVHRVQHVAGIARLVDFLAQPHAGLLVEITARRLLEHGGHVRRDGVGPRIPCRKRTSAGQAARAAATSAS